MILKYGREAGVTDQEKHPNVKKGFELTFLRYD